MAVEASSSWQHESRCEEELELLRVSIDLRLDGTLMRQAIKAGTAGHWAAFFFFYKDKLSSWSSVKVREFYREVEH